MGEKGDMYEETEHLDFDFVGYTGKTHIITVINKHSDDYIGEIKWFGRWRKYCFFPVEGTVYDAKCLHDISNFLVELMNDRKKEGR